MAAAQLDTVLRHLRGLTPAAAADLGDGPLLERFAADGDPSAFNALVQRYGRLVWGVCRNILGHHHDAEDAFQATFLILARSAASIRQTATVAGWLHGVAYRTAMRAKRDAARRRLREQVAGARQPATEVSEVSLRDLQAVLDEEVARLPEKLRTPFVLCALDGRSGAEAAQLLGCPVGTVSARLSQARQRLRQRLARRGVALTAALCAVEVARAAPPPALAREAVRAACATAMSATAGSTSPQVTALVEGVSRTMIATRTRIITTLLLALGLVAATTYRLSAVAPRPEQPPKAPPAKADPGKTTIAVRGRVLDPDGKPLANARLYWPRLLRMPPRSPDDITTAQVGSSDAEGRFSVKLQRIDTPSGRPLSLLAVADGFGIGWADVRTDVPAGALTVRLARDRPIRGQVLTTEGKPVPGAKIAITGLFSGQKGKLDAFLIGWKAEWRLAFQKTEQQLYFPVERVLRLTPTDRDGRFEVRGIGVERLVKLEFDAPGVARETVYVVNRAGFDPEPYNKAAQERSLPLISRRGMVPVLAGPTLRIVVEKTRVIEGVVKDAATGKPLPGVSIMSVSGYNNSLFAVSDANGRYRISGLAKSKDYSLHATPPGKSALMMRSLRITDDGGLGTIKQDIELVRGVVLTGRVIDRATGKGVRGGVRFAPLPGNKFFGKPGYDSYRYERLMHEINADGSYRLVVIPGSGVLMAQVYGGGIKLGGHQVNPYVQATILPADRKRVPVTEDGTFVAAGNAREFLNIENACKVLDLAPDAGTVKCDLFVERGKTLTVQVQDADGKPLPGATIGGMTASWPNVFPLKEASCTVYALDPQKPRTLVFYHVGRKLAGKLTVRGDEKEPPAVRLSAVGSVRGRLVDLDGQPLAGIEVRPSYPAPAAQELERQLNQGHEAVRTDKDGRFRLEGVIPDLKFGLSLVKGRTYFVGEPRIGQRQVVSGKELGLGTLPIKRGN